MTTRTMLVAAVLVAACALRDANGDDAAKFATKIVAPAGATFAYHWTHKQHSELAGFKDLDRDTEFQCDLTMTTGKTLPDGSVAFKVAVSGVKGWSQTGTAKRVEIDTSMPVAKQAACDLSPPCVVALAGSTFDLVLSPRGEPSLPKGKGLKEIYAAYVQKRPSKEQKELRRNLVDSQVPLVLEGVLRIHDAIPSAVGAPKVKDESGVLEGYTGTTTYTLVALSDAEASTHVVEDTKFGDTATKCDIAIKLSRADGLPLEAHYDRDFSGAGKTHDIVTLERKATPEPPSPAPPPAGK